MDWLTDYIAHTREQESPTAFHQWIGLVTIAAALKRQVWIDRGFYKVYPNLYAILVGPSGKQKKSTAINIATDMLYAVDNVTIMQERMTPEAIVLHLNSVKAEGNSVQRLSALHIVSPELQVMFGGNMQEASRTMGYLSTWYDSRDRFPHYTIGHGPIELHNMYITWIAACTPEWLKIIPPDAQGGFIGRLLFIYSDERKRVPRSKPSSMGPKLIEELRYISTLSGEVEVTPETWAAFDTAYEAVPETDDPRQAGFYERIHETWLKVAILLAVSRGGMTVDPGTFAESMTIVNAVAPAIKSALQYVGTSEHSQHSERILRQFIRKGGRMTRSELINANAWALSAEELDKIVKTLEARSLIETTIKGRAHVYQLTAIKKDQ